MKKSIMLALFMLVTICTVNAQDLANDTSPKQSEISTNLLDLVVAGTLNVNYERLFDKNQSLFIGVNFFDTYGYYDAGYIESSSAFSLKAAYFVYFSKEKDHSGFFFYPQLKLRTGEVNVDDGYSYFDGETDTFFEDKFTYDVGGVSAGFGIGHKWVFSNKFTLNLNADIARNLGDFDTDYLGAVEFRLGVNFGYRF